MGALKRMFRVSEWFGSKLPLQIAIFLFYAYSAGHNARTLLYPFFLFIVYSVTYFGISYLANDLSDVRDDEIAGKSNAFHTSSVKVGVAAFIIATAVHFASAMLISFSWEFLLFSLVGYLFGISYSFKPLRFKERGVLGLIVASFFQRNLQILVIPFIFAVDPVVCAFINIACFIYGIRYILIHQYIDYENDLKSGTRTFVGSAKRVTKRIIITCVLLETLISAVCFFILFSKVSLVFGILLAVGYILELALWLLMGINKQKELFTSYYYVPLNFVFLFAIPAISLAIILMADTSVLFFGIFYLVCLALAFCKTVRFYIEYLCFCLSKPIVARNAAGLAMATDRRGSVSFINLIPVVEEKGERPVVAGEYTVVSPLKIRLNAAELTEHFTDSECVELRYPIPKELADRLSDLFHCFQLNNDRLHSYFSVYIFNKKNLGVPAERTVWQTVVAALSECREVKTVNVGLHPVIEKPDGFSERDLLSFAGASLALLYWKKRDCFKRVLPITLIANASFLALALLGGLFSSPLMKMGIYCLAINLSLNLARGLILAIKSKVKATDYLGFVKNLYLTRVRGRRVPFYMVYGIFKEKLVDLAAGELAKFVILLFSVVISWILVALL